MKGTWKTTIPGAALLAAMLSGCASPPPTPEPKPMIPTVIAGMNVPPDDVENIRYNEAVKQYRSGRYIDPNNTRIMYERNVVYKVEDDAAWNLRPNAGTTVSPATGNPDKRPRVLDAQKPLYAEMETQIREMKHTASKAVAAVESAQRANATSAETRVTVQSQSATMAVTVKTIGAINDNMRELDRKLAELEAKTKEIEAARRASDAPKDPMQSAKPFNLDAPMPDEGITFKSQQNKTRDAK